MKHIDKLLDPKIDYVFKRIFGYVGNEEIKHLAMMITSFLQEGAGVFAFCQSSNITCRFIFVVLEHYPSTYIQKGDETWSIISVMKPQRTGSSVQSAN